MIPGMLYKYAGPDRLDVLVRKRIAYTSPRGFNDPFEAQPFLKALASDSYIRELAEREGPSILEAEIAKLPLEMRGLIATPEVQAALSKGQKSLVVDMLAMQPGVMANLRSIFANGVNLIGILCLAQNPADLLMWAHYGASHEGICIGFDAAHQHFDDRRSPKDSLRHLRPVAYQEERPKVNIAELGGLELYLTKGREWAYEAEWRIARAIADADEVLTPESGNVHLFTFPPEAVRQVILGCRASEKTRQRAVEIVRTQEWRHVELLETVVHESEYQLELRSVV